MSNNYFQIIFKITVQDITLKTGMHPQDIALTMMLLSFVRKNPENKFILAIDWTKVDQHMQRVATSLANKTRFVFFLVTMLVGGFIKK